MTNQTEKNNIQELLGKYSYDHAHAYRSKNSALLIFDKTRGIIHNFQEQEKRLLEAGALLHVILGILFRLKNIISIRIHLLIVN